jgi:EAL domain-containing protein (putative c-di-GMP-specific phosphodiesterase class I)/GGDEF domain-containing protein
VNLPAAALSPPPARAVLPGLGVPAGIFLWASGLGLISAALALVLVGAPYRGHLVVALWPLSAICFAFSWRFGWGWAWPAAIAGGAAYWLIAGNAWLAASVAISNAAAAGVGARILAAMVGWKPVEHRIEATARFICVALGVIAPLSALGMIIGLALLAPDQAPAWVANALSLWIAESIGLLALAPFVLSLISVQDRLADQGKKLDTLWVLGACGLAVVITAVSATGRMGYAHGLLFLTFPLMAAAGIRFNEYAFAAAMALTAVLVMLAFRMGIDPGLTGAAGSVSINNLLQASLVLLCAVVMGLLLQAVSSDRRFALARMAQQARQDMSTGLFNDRGLLAELGDLLVANKRPNYGLVGVQVSNFDTLNDLCGPVTALQLEQSAAALLQQQSGLVLAARLSSGRYCALIKADSVSQVRTVARDLYSQINGQVFKAEHGSLRLIASAGGLLIDRGIGVNAEDCMLSLSDAMAIASSVRDPQLFVEPLSQTTIDARRAHQEKMEHIREAIREQRFEVYAQPIVDSDAPAGMLSYEVLVRLKDAAGNIMKPPEFLPLAAQAQLTAALDRGVIRSVFSWLSLHPTQLARTWKCSINLSGLTMSDGTAASYIRETRSEFGIAADKIVFEITESEAIRNPAAASRLVDELRNDGFLIALDDFGTGLATFEYLKRFPIDYLKIDGSFIRNLITNPIDEEIVLSTIRVARRLNVKTVAEHVHSQEIFDRLRHLGIDHLQGDLISRPRPLADLFTDDMAAVNLAEALQ